MKLPIDVASCLRRMKYSSTSLWELRMHKVFLNLKNWFLSFCFLRSLQ